MIPYGRQSISESDIQEVIKALRSPFITQGPRVATFENALADYCGSKHAIAVSSGTAALHVACIALDLGPGDWLWTVPITFVASANCGLSCGASVDFVDIHPQTHTMDPDALAAKLEIAARADRLPKVVVPVHLTGRSCDMVPIHRLAGEYGFAILEDACHAIGASYGDTTVGSCAHSNMAVFSFHPVKLVTTGEGGAITTNDDEAAARLRRLREHGYTRESPEDGEASEPWHYRLIELGYNYRITDLQAALGTSQMQRLDEFVARRNELADRYRELLSGLPLRTPPPVESGRSAYHLFVVHLEDTAHLGRREAFRALREAGIGVQVHYIPVHTQPLYRELGFRAGDFPQAEAYYANAITLPLFHGMTDAEQDEVVSTLRRILA